MSTQFNTRLTIYQINMAVAALEEKMVSLRATVNVLDRKLDDAIIGRQDEETIELTYQELLDSRDMYNNHADLVVAFKACLPTPHTNEIL